MRKDKEISVNPSTGMRLPDNDFDWKFQRVCATCNESLPLGLFNKGKRSCRGCTKAKDRKRDRRTTGREFTQGEKKEPKPQHLALTTLIAKAMECGKLHSLAIQKKVMWKAYYVAYEKVQKLRAPLDEKLGFDIGVTDKGAVDE